jgi:hypothetical protein
LPDGYIDAINRFTLFKIFALIDNGINGNCRFSGLAVANDKFALAASDGNHGINGF